ncbi:hypothetical protein [Methanohalophilus halophilus]|uniref:Uncharacterized protein n=1 Tax=Methanohalophilus halophilus TaxID=2177 RepID=A0A1L3PZP4_9EURY|nr:hypothetical protein [Methanohalophilus halophilus]APH38097.1 hypothetical protein BHR79_00450 [Methanohalophilus halophilus]RNI11038.1 hypothetical protein EFE40_02350 [Methanohalophilus halophilus]SDW83038.1 hypothetical protein SAMN04515625_1688 [Methanohalophilus halophilus]
MGIDRVIQEQKEKQNGKNIKKSPINEPPRWKIKYPSPSIERPVSEYEISHVTLENKTAELESVKNNYGIPNDEKIRLKRKLKAEIKHIKIALGYETNIDVINPSTNEYNYSSDKTTFYKQPLSVSKPKSLSEKLASKVGDIFKSIKGKN